MRALPGLATVGGCIAGRSRFLNPSAWDRGRYLVNRLFNEHYADCFDPMNAFRQSTGFQIVFQKLAVDFTSGR